MICSSIVIFSDGLTSRHYTCDTVDNGVTYKWFVNGSYNLQNTFSDQCIYSEGARALILN